MAQQQRQPSLTADVRLLADDVVQISGVPIDTLADILYRAGVEVAMHGVAVRDKLSDREVDVLRLIAEGRSNAEIATALRISAHTVKGYVRSTYRKIEVTSRPQAMSWALRHGVHADPPAKRRAFMVSTFWG
ncbi:response regulator transcription factor [Nocardioides mangrovicus]|nr:helix-turn-helix transcriptional regulator [Nocardioides mangrovicus]